MSIRRAAAAVCTGLLGILALALAGCIARTPLPTVYDFDAIEPVPAPAAHLSADLNVLPISAPTWLASTAIAYRLAYDAPALPQSYARSRWSAPPAELLTARLRALLAAANARFTLTRGGPAAGGYRLEVTLERLEQVYSAPQISQGRVSLRATVTGASDGHLVAQRSFEAERPAANGAPGGVRALVEGSDQCFAQLLVWLQGTLPAAPP